MKTVEDVLLAIAADKKYASDENGKKVCNFSNIMSLILYYEMLNYQEFVIGMPDPRIAREEVFGELLSKGFTIRPLAGSSIFRHDKLSPEDRAFFGKQKFVGNDVVPSKRQATDDTKPVGQVKALPGTPLNAFIDGIVNRLSFVNDPKHAMCRRAIFPCSFFSAAHWKFAEAVHLKLAKEAHAELNKVRGNSDGIAEVISRYGASLLRGRSKRYLTQLENFLIQEKVISARSKTGKKYSDSEITAYKINLKQNLKKYITKHCISAEPAPAVTASPR